MTFNSKAIGARLVLAICAWGMAALTAAANDSTANLDTGELVLIPNPDIVMQEEDLFISRDEIRVRYVFFNTSDRTITTPVAFPLPPVNFDWEDNFAIVPLDRVNFVDFRLWIDGRPTPFRIDARALNTDGEDITDLLVRNNIPITTFTSDEDDFTRLRAHLDNLPPQVMAELRAAGAIHPKDWGDYFSEAWTAQVAFYWVQSFPPGRRVTVEHRYVPVPTHTYYGPADLDARNLYDDACIDSAFDAAVRRRLAGQEYGTMDATILTYILTTANNWRGPIGRFRLTIDKGSGKDLVSLCRSGIRKTGPTTFEWEGYDFRPDRDLTVLFLSPFETE